MITLTAHTRESLRDDLYEAQEHLTEAIRLIENYVRLTNDYAAEAYLLNHLQIFAGNDHGFLSSDMNLDDLIDSLDETDADEDDEDDAPTYPRTKTGAAGATLYLLQNNNGPILNAFGEPRYVTIPED